MVNGPTSFMPIRTKTNEVAQIIEAMTASRMARVREWEATVAGILRGSGVLAIEGATIARPAVVDRNSGTANENIARRTESTAPRRRRLMESRYVAGVSRVQRAGLIGAGSLRLGLRSRRELHAGGAQRRPARPA